MASAGNVGSYFVDPLNLTGVRSRGGVFGPGDVNTSGPMPANPAYVTAYDPTTMSLSDYLTGKYDHSGYDAYKAEALRKGPSGWATAANLDQGVQAANQREKGVSANNAATAQAEDDLAARGGLSSGARERATTDGSKNYLAMSQDIARQENLNHMQIGMNDEQNRIQELSTVPGMEQSQAQMWEGARQQDINNTTAENERRNQYNQNLYNQQMTTWRANRQADATQNSGKK